MATPNNNIVVPAPIPKLNLDLTAQQLATIARNGQMEAKNGTVYGDADDYNDEDTKTLDNRTVKVLNTIIANLRANPIPVETINSILTGTTDIPLMERFGTMYFELAESQIYTPQDDNGIPPDPYIVSYPLRNILDKLEQHKSRYDPGILIADGIIIDGVATPEDELPIYDYMFDEDDNVNDCFWYTIKMLVLVL